MSVNYTLYLVTDSTESILKGKNLEEVVDAAIRGGVTVVQYRDKQSDTAELISMAKKLHSITKKHNVPLLINDRVDVALAMGADGVHIGQDDMDLATARRLLGETAIIGVTASSPQEALNAAEQGANYLGIGTMFSTPTKEDTKAVIGTSGTREILASLSETNTEIPCVAIGGINASNIQRVIYQSRSASKGLDGIALVSAIVAAEDPKEAAADLKKLLKEPAAFAKASVGFRNIDSVQNVLEAVPSVIKALQEKTPLSHNMTNLVVQNFAANVALAIGASPIMAGYGAEAPDLSKLGGSLVVNMGSVDSTGLGNYRQAIQAYNEQGGPILFDPVGAGATHIRRAAVKSLMASGYFDVIKGNEGEIKTVAGEIVQQKGVDSGSSTLDGEGKARLVKKLAAKEGNVVLLTGAVDFVSDGRRTFAIKNGHSYLGIITGAGCTLGTTIASCLAVYPQDKLVATVAGLLLFEISAEFAAGQLTVQGPGTFIPAFIDELHQNSTRSGHGDNTWLKRALVEEMLAE